MADNETIADIVAEKRRRADELEASSYRPHQFLRERIAELRQEASHLEAAHKREVDAMRTHVHNAMVRIMGIETPDPNNPPKLWTALEDVYDELCEAVGADGDTTADEAEAKAKGLHFVVLPTGNSAALREALKLCLRGMCGYCRMDAEARGMTTECVKGCEALLMAKAALAAPPRNCDKYENAKDAWFTFDALQSKKGAKWHWTEYADWLFAPAQEGGNDGR